MNWNTYMFATLENVVMILNETEINIKEILEKEKNCTKTCRSCNVAKQIQDKIISMREFAHKTNRDIFNTPKEWNDHIIKSQTCFNPDRDTI